MSLRFKYTNPVQILVAVALLLVNAGFTSVLHSCLMDDKVCCETFMMDGDHAIPSTSPSFNPTGAACCANAIVGGLSGFSALSESKGKTETQKSILLHLVAGPFTPTLQPAVPSSYYFSTQYPSSPPSREIYILTSSLLI